ncbi:hypothetical protein EVAR_27587_1 [Eumeta japonica]|uniref:Uncharacterized protein n=1 Tax=Eumeta variegata TaxID=151549 RepID=A0A4C1WBC0_EUMVA|nr:hypothetical protein EVAR_27587_1 [Eumeta japonica]
MAKVYFKFGPGEPRTPVVAPRVAPPHRAAYPRGGYHIQGLKNDFSMGGCAGGGRRGRGRSGERLWAGMGGAATWPDALLTLLAHAVAHSAFAWSRTVRLPVAIASEPRFLGRRFGGV